MSRPIAADFIAQVTNYEGEKLCGVDLHSTKSVLHAYSGECKGERDEGEFIICAHEISLSPWTPFVQNSIVPSTR